MAAPRVASRVVLALRTWPSSKDWIEALIALFALSLVLGAFGWTTGLLHWAPRSGGEIAHLAATSFFAPALLEELVFRAALVSAHSEVKAARAPILLSVALFTAWHVAETLWLPRAAPLFLRWDFLLSAAALGATCALLRWLSGSIWSAVALHWALVIGWLGWLGGPGLADLVR